MSDHLVPLPLVGASLRAPRSGWSGLGRGSSGLTVERPPPLIPPYKGDGNRTNPQSYSTEWTAITAFHEMVLQQFDVRLHKRCIPGELLSAR